MLARGFDQANVTLVVNYDIPVNVHPPYDPEYETYLHRIGRSGRFGRKGAAFNFVAGDRDAMKLNKIEEHFQREIKEVRNPLRNPVYNSVIDRRFGGSCADS